MISPVREPTSWIPVAELMLTKMRKSGSRKSTPGNIWVDRTVVVKTERPRKLNLETAKAARMARSTLAAVATVATMMLLTK